MVQAREIYHSKYFFYNTTPKFQDFLCYGKAPPIFSDRLVRRRIRENHDSCHATVELWRVLYGVLILPGRAGNLPTQKSPHNGIWTALSEQIGLSLLTRFLSLQSGGLTGAGSDGAGALMSAFGYKRT